ncbi:hypothetical protein HPB47_002804 [Ixodes persulcatus]|uniref:Uncharacterized protein n=1 Tax=Ixodes persulcatus TaxID=34615 RepID=A0AC60QZC5_IXOPE|nr:hypothetical protein HPB47_002804 [Ixodes persulcatus]
MTAVSRIIQAYRDEGGRYRRTSEEVDQLMAAAAVADPFQSAQELRDALDLDVSLATIRQQLREPGHQSCVVAQKPYLTDRQQRQRLDLARAHEDWTISEWGEVIFMDESTFS